MRPRVCLLVLVLGRGWSPARPLSTLPALLPSPTSHQPAPGTDTSMQRVCAQVITVYNLSASIV